MNELSQQSSVIDRKLHKNLFERHFYSQMPGLAFLHELGEFYQFFENLRKPFLG